MGNRADVSSDDDDLGYPSGYETQSDIAANARMIAGTEDVNRRINCSK